MNDIAIRCEGLGKQYRIGERERYRALRDTITDTLSAPFRRLSSIRHPPSAIRNTEFWALKDISFEVKRGEVVGIIGRNGAGKSTLLKILSRITAPSAGRVEISGRVGSLLEVGTGFHPELTGRENIFLNGAILGMRKAEIERKFDEIVAFAEIEKFIDTPVKRYSSGMYVRLAFAVAAYLDPEILVVDEVLAVGDAEFQKKCLGRMNDMAKKQERTVLFVSHSMPSILRLCERVLLLEKGILVSDSSATEAVDRYLGTLDTPALERYWTAIEQKEATYPFQPVSIRLVTSTDNVSGEISPTQPFWVELEYELHEEVRDLRVGLFLYSNRGDCILTSYDRDDKEHYHLWSRRATGLHRARCRFPANWLAPGRYRVGVNASSFGVTHFFWDESALTFKVNECGSLGIQWNDIHREGFLRPSLDWAYLE